MTPTAQITWHPAEVRTFGSYLSAFGEAMTALAGAVDGDLTAAQGWLTALGGYGLGAPASVRSLPDLVDGGDGLRAQGTAFARLGSHVQYGAALMQSLESGLGQLLLGGLGVTSPAAVDAMLTDLTTGQDFSAPAPPVHDQLTDYDTQQPSTETYTIAPRPGHGTVRFQFFIWGDNAGWSLPGAQVAAGNVRGFDPFASPADNKGSIEVNYETGQVSIRIDPSCEQKGRDLGFVGLSRCDDALAINPRINPFTHPGGALTFVEHGSNTFTLSQDGNGAVHLRWSFQNSQAHVLPAISGNAVVTPGPSGTVGLTTFENDNFPSIDVWHDDPATGTSNNLYRRKQGVLEDLYGPAPNLNTSDSGPLAPPVSWGDGIDRSPTAPSPLPPGLADPLGP